jgi:hypothetical protein
MGLTERVNIYATMLWLAALAIALLRAEGITAPRHLGTLSGTARTVELLRTCDTVRPFSMLLPPRRR